MNDTPPAHHVEITRESRVRRLGGLAWTLGAPLLGMGALTQVGGGVGEAALMLTLIALACAPLLAFLLFAGAPILAYLARARHRGSAVAVTDAEGLRVMDRGRARWSVPWSEVGVAWVREAVVVELATAKGDEARLIFQSPEGAARFVRMVRSRAQRRRAYPLALEGDVMRLVRKASSWFFPSAIALGLLAAGPWGLLSLPVSIGLSWLGARGSRRMMLGADGVLIEGRFRRRYVPYKDIARVEMGTALSPVCSLSLRLVSGRRVSLGSWLGARRAALAKALLEEGVRMAERGAEAGAEVGSLAKGAHEGEDAWRARVLAAARRSGYRGPALDPETLLSLMRNPAADPEQRVAAALAMRTSDDGVSRIRVAAEVAAEPGVREALDALSAPGELDEVRVSRALKRLSSGRR